MINSLINNIGTLLIIIVSITPSSILMSSFNVVYFSLRTDSDHIFWITNTIFVVIIHNIFWITFLMMTLPEYLLWKWPIKLFFSSASDMYWFISLLMYYIFIIVTSIRFLIIILWLSPRETPSWINSTLNFLKWVLSAFFYWFLVIRGKSLSVWAFEGFTS